MSYWKQHWGSDGADLYLGNCLDVMPHFKNINHVITDPPFEKEAHTQKRRVKRGGGVMEIESLPFASMDEATRNLAAQYMSALSQGWILTFCQIEAVMIWKKAIENGGATYKRSMIWVKPDGMPQYSGDRPGMGYETIVAAWGGGW